jgi:hypothetical protein
LRLKVVEQIVAAGDAEHATDARLVSSRLARRLGGRGGHRQARVSARLRGVIAARTDDPQQELLPKPLVSPP